MPPRSRGIALPTFSQCALFLGMCFGGWWAWGAFGDYQVRQNLWNPEATATERIRAADAWSEFGPEAVPELIRALNDSSVQTRRYAAVALAQLESRGRAAVPHLRLRLKDPNPIVRRQAAATLAAVDPQSTVSMEAVAELMTDRDPIVRQESAASLRNWGALAQPVVIARLKHPLPEVRLLALDLLPRKAPARRAALPAVRELTNDSSPAVQEAAICIIVEAGAASVDELIDWLELDSERIRAVAIPSLRRYGQEAVRAIPHLVVCLECSPLRNQLLAIELLKSLGADARAAVPALVAYLERVNDRGLVPALQAIEVIGGGSEILAEPLARLTTHANPIIAGTALRILDKYEPDIARRRIEQIIATIDDPDLHRFHVTCGVIASAGSVAAKAIPQLQARLKDDNPHVRLPVLTALRSFGPSAESAVPALVSLLDESEHDVQLFDSIVETIIAIGANASYAADSILSRLEEFPQRARESPQARDHRQARLIVAAARIGVRSSEFRESLQRFLESGRPTVRIAALDAMAMMGTSDEPERSLILESLESVDPATRMAAIHAVPAAIGAESGAASALADRLNDPELRVRVAAAQALGRMGGSAEPALPALRTAIHDSTNEGSAIQFVPGSFGPHMPRIEAREDEQLPPGATVTDVMEQAIREIEATSAAASD